MTSNATSSEPYFCSSIWPLDVPRIHLTIFAVSQTLSFPFTIFSNSVLIYALYKTEQLNTITNKFIFAMNLSDLCIGIFGQPMVVIMFFIKDIFRSCILEKCVEYIVFLCANFSWFMLLCISVDRYLLVTKLNTYNAFMNPSRMKLLIGISFIAANGLAAILLSVPSFILQVLFNIANITMMVFVSLVYAYIMRRLKSHSETLNNLTKDKLNRSNWKPTDEQATQSEIQQSSRQNVSKVKQLPTKSETKNQLSALKTIQMLLVAIFALYGPYNIASTYRSYYKFGMQKDPTVAIDVFVLWAYFIVLTNASINAVIIINGNSKTRRFVLSRLACRCILQNKVTAVAMGTSTSDTRLTNSKNEQPNPYKCNLKNTNLNIKTDGKSRNQHMP